MLHLVTRLVLGLSLGEQKLKLNVFLDFCCSGLVWQHGCILVSLKRSASGLLCLPNLSNLPSNLQLVTGLDQGLKASPQEYTMKAQLTPTFKTRLHRICLLHFVCNKCESFRSMYCQTMPKDVQMYIVQARSSKNCFCNKEI